MSWLWAPARVTIPVMDAFTADPRDQMQTLSMARVGFGLFGLLSPRMFTRFMLGRGHAARETSLFVRFWGAREIAIGMMTLHELESDKPSRRVVELNAAVDAADSLAAVIAARSLPRRTRMGVVLGGAAAALVSINYLRTQDR